MNQVYRTVFELSINLIETFMVIWFMSEFLGYRLEKPKRQIGFGIAWLVNFLELSYLNYLMPFEGLLAFIQILIYIVYARICLKGRFTRQLFVIFFTQAIVAMVSMVSSFAMSGLLHVSVEKLFGEFSAERILMVVSGRLLLFYLFRLILQLKSREDFSLRRWLGLVILPALSLVSIIFLMEIVLLAPETTLYALLASGAVVLTNVVTLFLMARVARNQELENENSMMRLQQESVDLSEKNLMAMYETVSAIRHDLNDHLIAVSAMLQEGETEKAEDYVESLRKGYATRAKTVLTDNRMFNAIVNTKLALCAQKRIETIVRVQDGVLDFLEPEEMVSLLGNLFNNAIEAAEQSAERVLRFEVQGQRGYASVCMENSVYASVLADNRELRTTKEDKKVHGFGVKNIRRIVERYDGVVEFREEEESGRFCCDILLKPMGKQKISE